MCLTLRKTLKPETPSTPTGGAANSITTVAAVAAGTDNAREMLVSLNIL